MNSKPRPNTKLRILIVPTLRVVTQCATLRVNLDAERPTMHSHAEPIN
jgi:hypothetical protein